MTTSLTSIFEAAYKDSASWGSDRVRSILSVLNKRFRDTHVDWEEGDETWARLLRNDQVIVLISTLIPLVIVQAAYCDEVNSIASNCNVIPAESFTRPDFTVKKELLERIVSREVSDNLNYDALSIDDLWWATV